MRECSAQVLGIGGKDACLRAHSADAGIGLIQWNLSVVVTMGLWHTQQNTRGQCP